MGPPSTDESLRVDRPVANDPQQADALTDDALSRLHGATPDWDGARAGFEQAAALGSARAASYLGWIYEHGHGVERDHRQAAHWYARVARAGVPDFAVKLGWMYMGGGQLPADRQRAEAWFGEAVAAGHLPANVALASVLIADAQGGIAPHRVHEARALLDTALEGELRLAAFFLARLYVEGIGGHPQDEALGLRYTRMSAEDGQALMQGRLAQWYLEGRGVPVDPLEAAFWAALAAAGEDPLGRSLHAELGQRLTDAERQAVLERTMRWALEGAQMPPSDGVAPLHPAQAPAR